MEFTDALNKIKGLVAKATGGTMTMTAEELLGYANEQAKAAEGEDEATRLARFEALAGVLAKAEAAHKAGSTTFEVDAFKPKTATATAKKDESGLDKLIEQLTVSVHDLTKAVRGDKAPATVNPEVDAAALAKAAAAKSGEEKPADAKASEKASEEKPAEVEKSAKGKAKGEPVDWSVDLAAEVARETATAKTSK